MIGIESAALYSEHSLRRGFANRTQVTWVSKLFWLRDMERRGTLRQMNIKAQKLNVVLPSADILVFRKAGIIDDDVPKPPIESEIDYSLDKEDFISIQSRAASHGSLVQRQKCSGCHR